MTGGEVHLNMAEEALKGGSAALGVAEVVLWARKIDPMLNDLWWRLERLEQQARQIGTVPMVVDKSADLTKLVLPTGHWLELSGLVALGAGYAEWSTRVNETVEVLETAGPSPVPTVLQWNGRIYALVADPG